jgi:hypothetical protein
MTAVMPLSRASVESAPLWEHCRNSLGIARLLVHEGRPEAFVATACRMAVENGCRAALEQVGMPFDGNLEEALRRLCLAEVDAGESRANGAERLAAAEKTLSRIAAYLRGLVPERTWGL